MRLGLGEDVERLVGLQEPDPVTGRLVPVVLDREHPIRVVGVSVRRRLLHAKDFVVLVLRRDTRKKHHNPLSEFQNEEPAGTVESELFFFF